MELNNIYLDEEIINIFFDLLDFTSKINFTNMFISTFARQKNMLGSTFARSIRKNILMLEMTLHGIITVGPRVY